MREAVDKVENKARDVEHSDAAGWVAAAGHVANGVVHAIIGLIAIGVARGAGGNADQGGAMRAIDSTPVGSIALWVVGLAMIGLGIYTLAEGIGLLRGDVKDAVKSFGRMVAYFAVGTIALTYALGGSSDSAETTQSLSAQLMSTAWGSILIGIVGAVIVGVGIAMIVKGVRKKFLEDVKMSSRSQRWFTPLGMAGYVAKGLAVVAVGVLFLVAVWKNDPSSTGGLDSALKSFTELPFGQWVLMGIGVGLILYGVFCVARARKVKPR